MKTPICDFVKQYTQLNPLRMHMPGHKGLGPLGFEQLDITEFWGADSLYEPSGIIAQSEANASILYGCPTFYSTEGSSQCVRAMIYLAMLDAKHRGKTLKIAAGRNAHKAFLTAVSLLDTTVTWLYPEEADSYLSCTLTPQDIEKTLLQDRSITAVYLTMPDYLGNVADIAALAEVCHRYSVLLLVDNAHGAYLRFLPKSRHPMDLGADICCDSAHKTLPVLTGGAYLHIRNSDLAKEAKKAMALFGSTSPSYLILQSLDAVNPYLETYPKVLSQFLPQVQDLKSRLQNKGFYLAGNEPLKITLCPKSYGYTAAELEKILYQNQIVCEFADPDYLVLMVSPQTGVSGLKKLENTLMAIAAKPPIMQKPPCVQFCEPLISPRQAILSASESILVDHAVGRILSAPSVGCPPAVPIVLCGQRITEQAVAAFHYYGITHCDVLKENQTDSNFLSKQIP